MASNLWFINSHVTLLARGSNGKDTAEKLGVTTETVSRWRSDFDFQAALNQLLIEAQQESKDKLRHLSSVALATLEDLMSDLDTSAKDRLTAALKILEITNVKTGVIGSTNANVLKSEKEQDDLLESYNL